MDNKEYGVKLNVDIRDFTKKIDNAIDLAEKAKKSIEEPLRKVKITRDGTEEELKIKADTEPLKKQLKETAEEFEKRMANIKPKIFDNSFYNPDADRSNEVFKDWYGEDVTKDNEYWKNFSETKGGNYDLSDFTKNTEQATEDMQDLGDATNNTGKEANKTTIIFGHFGKDVSRTIKQSVNNLKRFGLSLFGIHSAWTALSRAVRSYMAYDEKANARTQANWIALGAMFAPIVEKIGKMIQKLVGYINVFYKALTGKSFIQVALDKVKAKANGTSKAVKGLNKELASFDEITNLNFDKGEDKDFGIADALEELENTKLDETITKTLENIAEYIKNNILPSLDSVRSFIEKHILPTISSLYKAFEDLGIPWESLLVLIGLCEKGIAGGMITAVGLLILKVMELYDVWERRELQRNILLGKYSEGLQICKKQIKEYQKVLDDANSTDEQRKEAQQQINYYADQAQQIYEQYGEDLKNNYEFSKDQREEIEKQAKAIEKITGTKWKSKIDYEVNSYLTQQAKNTFDEIKRLSTLTVTLSSLIPGLGITGGMIISPLIDSLISILTGASRGNQLSNLKNLRGFAKGNVAYGPTVAEFGEYAGARSNPEITAPQSIMKQTMIEALQEANLSGNNNNKGGDTILYVNGKELARATYGDYESERNRLGTSNVAIRRV